MTRVIALSALVVISPVLFLLGQSQQQNESAPPRTFRGGGLTAANRETNQEGPREVSVSVNQQSNPLLDATKQVAEELETAVSFEEPEWIADADLMRFVDTPQSLARPPEIRARIDLNIKVQGAGTIEAHALLRAPEDRFELAGQLLQACLDDHTRRGNPGKFKLVRLDNYGYSIVPVEVRGRSGEWLSASSPLDARISFRRQKRLLGPTLELISQAISKSSGKRIEPDIYSLPGINGIYDVALTDIGAENEVARDVLARTLREMTVPNRSSLMLSWHAMPMLDHDRKKDAPAYVLRFTSLIHTHVDGTRNGVYWPDPSKTK